MMMMMTLRMLMNDKILFDLSNENGRTDIFVDNLINH